MKTLVYNYFADEQYEDTKITKIHFECIKHYFDIFDNVIFVISLNDTSNVSLIRVIEEKITELHKKGSLTFKICQNNEYRESQTFKTEVIDKLEYHDLVFFAHNKGITNVKKYKPDNIYKWVIAMYFYNLNFIYEVENSLYNKKCFSYGTFLTKFSYQYNLTTFDWQYIGTYFWVNGKKLFDYIERNKIKLPNLCDRFYDEEFLGNIFDCWPQTPLASSHNDSYIMDAVDYYNNIDSYMDLIGYNTDDFNDFYNTIMKHVQ